MWRCPKCGEAIADNFDACWRCGVDRDGNVSEGIRPEPNDDSVPGPKPVRQSPLDAGAERPLTQEGLAVLLLRFLGVFFTASAIIRGIEQVSYLLLIARQFGLDEGLRYYHWEYLAHAGAELIIGIYFLVGGQWVFDKILMPVMPISPEDSPPGTEESDDSRGVAGHGAGVV